MKLLFQLGRDIEIAKIELCQVLKKYNFVYEILSDEDNILIIDAQVDDSFGFNEIQNSLASTIRIAHVLYTDKIFSISGLYRVDIFLSKKSNVALNSHGVSGDEYKYILKEFKEWGKKQSYKIQFKQIQGSKDVDPKRFHSWNLDNGFELFVAKIKSGFVVSKTLTCTNPNEYILKDTKRPDRFFTHGTSFRLAKTMVNILGLSEGKTFVDPFCGTGTFLIEGLLNKNSVIGIDNDLELINASKRNINWFIKEYKISNNFTYELIHNDSRYVKLFADGSVFEPYMGPFLKSTPNSLKASKIMMELNHLYSDIFKNLNSSLPIGSKVVCILPFLKSYQNEIFDIKVGKVIKDNGFKFLDFKKEYNLDILNPLIYSTPDGSRIGRKLYVVQKS